MSNETATSGTDSVSASVSAVGGSKGLVIVSGLISIIFGALLLNHPQGVLSTITFLVGLWLLIAGVLQFVAGFGPGLEGGSRAALFLSGVLSLFIGLFLVKHIISDSVGSDAKAWALFAILIGANWLITGMARLFAGIANPGMPGRGFTIFSGVITIIAAIVVLASPLSSLAVLVWITGIWLIVLGVLEVVAGLFIKRS